jgi:DNA helicase-2/ATP-dependent DNA helicase PcrA
LELSKVQKEAVDFYTGCCNVIASAGSGKTRVLVNRIVNLIDEYDVEPGKILAITFSKKAKENMVERLQKMIPEYANLINIETFHSFGYRIIRKFNREQFEILDADWKKVKIIEEILHQYFHEKEPDGQEIADVLSFISIQKNQMKKPNTSTKFGKIYQKYEEYKDLHNQLDFDDMLVKCYRILSTNEKCLAYCQEQYQFILADEMQDTNAVQYEILRLIGEKYKNVFVVDDPLQNIFMWRGSNNRYVMNFDQDWPDAKIIHLNKNYRSSQDIVSAANKFAQCIPESHHRHYVESVADKDTFEQPHYIRYADETSEANGVSSQVQELHELGYEYKDMAVLTRTNAQLQNFETAFYRNGVPYQVVDGMSFIDRREIKIVLCYLRLVCNGDDDEAFEYIYNRPNRWLGSAFLQEVKRIARKEKISLFSAMFKTTSNWRYKNAVNNIYSTVKSIRDTEYKSVDKAIADLRKRLNLDSYVSKDLCENDDSKVENLNTLERMASNYSDIKRFISFMMKFAKEKKSNPNSVQLMTIHKSKGLEFPVVFVAGVNQGLLPHEKNQNQDEEKRLMYVAITRAEKILNISSTQQYNGKDVKESEFIPVLF